ncbi:MAG: Gfo/Idh/MocA family oxidoreductase [Oscillospiraceae bacterium]|jgi:predicted dehydrogenase|nr:Gfo/Idh/MocA family oxidoreductase [Oscillospiraceae bacterium]
MLRIGFISAWHVHAGGYADHIKNSGKAWVTVVWDCDAERGKSFAAKKGAAWEPDYDQFLAREDVDAVVCCAPTTMHEELLTKAAKAGKHIFTEKLLTPDAAGAKRLAEAVSDAGVTFVISFPEKGAGRVQYIKQLLTDGKLGTVTAARFRRSHSGVSGGWLPPYWFELKDSGGGSLMDLGAHPVYILSDFFGAPTRITALMSNIYGTSSDENAIVLAEFANGVLGTMETGFVTDCVSDELEVYGTKGYVAMGGQNRLWTRLAGEEERDIPREEWPTAKPSPLAQFIDAAIAGEKSVPGLDLEKAVLLTEITEAAYAADKKV